MAALRAAGIELDERARSRKVWRPWNGRRVFSDGMNAPSSTARIIPPPPAFLPKPGASSWRSTRHAHSRDSLRQRCRSEFARRSHRLPSPFCFRESAANARPDPDRACPNIFRPLLHHSPTPLLRQSLTRSIRHAPNRIPF